MRTLLALSALLLAAEGPDGSRRAVVVAEAIEVLDGPDEAAFSTGRLQRGARVNVLRIEPGGWVEIEPPEGAFDWIPRDAVEVVSGRSARVVTRRAVVRAGCEGARMPGAARLSLRAGAIVHLIARPPLQLRRGGESQTWLAIQPPRGDARFLRAEGIKMIGDEGPA
ncbi:MAG: SH3 domain-containing protein, partial [Isosphaeraceae bacterium]|nr:SH3 domain-containing protein [Isosphaeraceae bacterium]